MQAATYSVINQFIKFQFPVLFKCHYDFKSGYVSNVILWSNIEHMFITIRIFTLTNQITFHHGPSETRP